MRTGTCAALLVFASLFPAAAVRAQSSIAGSIAGVVKDTSGAVLPGVTVEAASPALIEKVRTVSTDGNGGYKIENLRPGTYTVTFTLSGFGTVRHEDLELTAGFTATVHAEMRVGTVEETVTVTGVRPVVDTQNVRATTVLSREELDTLPAERSLVGIAALTLGVVAGGTAGNGSAVGGSKGEGHDTTMVIHGGRANDMQTTVDGMLLNNSLGFGGGGRQTGLNQAAIQEVVVETGGSMAASETGGVLINAVPKEGGNTFKLYFNGLFTTGRFQSDNISDTLRARGLKTVPNVKNAYDASGGVGGPVVRDKLWFYGAQRWWGGTELIPGNYYNATPLTLFYTPDLTQPADRSRSYRDTSVRLTWQAGQKHKINLNQSYQGNCNCQRGVELNQSPESSVNIQFRPNWQTIVSWLSPMTTRLLLEAAGAYLFNGVDVEPTDERWRTQRSVLELSNGYRYGSQFLGGASLDYRRGNRYDHLSTRASVSYITGSHAYKVGLSTLSGVVENGSNPYYDVGYVFSNGVPVQIQEFASPHREKTRATKLGLYGQDQWNVSRVTVNLGLRVDHFNAFVPAQVRPAGNFLPELRVAEVPDVPNWNDVSLRMGVTYDLFGNAKTALKASFGRFLLNESVATAQANNPAAQVVTSVSRNWADINGNFAPDCDLKNPLANGECGQISNLAFGQVRPNSVYSPALLKGFGIRPASWQTAINLQHELRPGVGLSVGFFRTSYVNFRATNNLLVSPSDFDPFCVTVPQDTRLPNGGGTQVCGNFDAKPSAFGVSQLEIVDAGTFGQQTETFNGLDLSINARFAKRGLVFGGFSTGRTVTDNCYQNGVPNIAAQGYVPGTPRSEAFCRITPPWSAGSQMKVSGTYPLPLDFQISALYQNLAGVPIQASYVTTNAQVASTLGRNLSSCRGQVPCNGTVTINVIPANSVFEDRLQQLDVRVTKNIRYSKYRIRANLDVYNVLNGSTVTASNTRYGPSWLLPTTVQGARLFEFSGQLDF